VTPGDVFFAYVGDADGRSYIADAVEQRRRCRAV
jgi:UDP-N-acetylmuramoyl-L-alanyl-D-glutamate--2,6-diaminopimelate ligase